MIACEKCGVANMADNRFCRECGESLARTTTAPRSEEDQKMVKDAQRLFAESRYDEAAIIADAILESDPYCVEALAIKGDCHERLGEYALALASYRDILTVDPESQLDRIRVARLEKIVSSGDIEIGPASPRRKTAFAAAFAAMVLLVSSGSALILATQGKEEPTPNQTVASSDHQSSPFLPIPPVPSGYSGYTLNNQAGPQNPDLEGLQDIANTATPLVPKGTTQPMGGGILPRVSGETYDPSTPTRVEPEKVGPVRPNVGPGVLPQNTAGNGDPDPPVLPNNQSGGDGRGMIVDVRPSQNNGTGGNNVTAEDRGAQIDTLIRVAREQQIMGNWAKAADAYEKALALGASPASTNQRLAQCYEKLGKTAEAIKAYERAIVAFEKLDQNDVRVQTQIEACRQALKLLRGN